MRHSLKVGFSFGTTSGVITVLGLLVGLNASTHSKMVVLGGILIIAIADAMSDALGIHISEESENVHTKREIWESTVATFFSKLITALTFVLPLIIFDLKTAVTVCVIWGFVFLTVSSFVSAPKKNIDCFKVIAEHVTIAGIVIILTYYLGVWVNNTFG